MISPSFPIRTGLVKPNRWMLSAICRICFLEWVRALPGCGRRLATGIGSIAPGRMVLGTCDWEAIKTESATPAEVNLLEPQFSVFAFGSGEFSRRLFV